MIALFLMAESMGCRASSFLWGLSPMQALTIDVEAWTAGMEQRKQAEERQARTARTRSMLRR